LFGKLADEEIIVGTSRVSYFSRQFVQKDALFFSGADKKIHIGQISVPHVFFVQLETFLPHKVSGRLSDVRSSYPGTV